MNTATALRDLMDYAEKGAAGSGGRTIEQVKADARAALAAHDAAPAMNATCYSLRNVLGVKVVGGSLGMSRDIPLAEGAAQVAAMLDVTVKSGGRVVFTRNGAEVYAYLSLDAGQTVKGRAALAQWRAERAAADAASLDDACPHCGRDDA